MQTLSDKEVITRVKNGEIDYFYYIVKKYTVQILTFVTKKLSNREDAEDIVQNSFLHFYKAINRFDQNKQIQPYLYQIVRNELKMLWRSRKITISLDEKIVADKEQEDLDIEDIERHLNKLPLEQKKTLQLVSEGYSYKEIAKNLKRPLNTVRTIIRRARLQLTKIKGYETA